MHIALSALEFMTIRLWRRRGRGRGRNRRRAEGGRDEVVMTTTTPFIFLFPADSRLSKFFPKPGELPIQLAGFWNLQACWAFFSLLPITMAHKMPAAKTVGSGALARAAGPLGATLFVCGLACEALADHQKSNFKARPGNAEAFCNEGIWNYSRHPNYFGEGILSYVCTNIRTSQSGLP